MVICIVQARMGSTRLKGKVLAGILGYPMVLLCLKRLQKSKYVDKLVLATSDLEEDDILYNTIKNAGFDVYRGDEQNVLKRYVACIKDFGGDTIVRVTGDCPLIDPVIIDHVISYYKMYNFDYVRLDVPGTFVRGFDVEVFSKAALLKAYYRASEEKYTEHVTSYMYCHPEDFSIGMVKGEKLYVNNYRLCVDTVEDYKMVKLVFEHFNDIYVSAKDVVDYLDANPEAANLNRDTIQKQI